MADRLPAFLGNARTIANRCTRPVDDSVFTQKWHKFVEDIQSQFPATRYNKQARLLSMGPISPGCHACRNGEWDCFFITSKCNLNCDFCISQVKASENFSGSNLGANIYKNLVLYSQLGINGISFSGGEALLEKERLISLIRTCSEAAWLNHIWMYTNGMLLDKETIVQLASCGLDEIRFNTVASGYQHPHVMAMIETAVKYLHWVTVEIPLIPKDESLLLDSLEKWTLAGVRTLNIHELIYEPNSNSENLSGEKLTVTLPDGHRTAVSPHSDQMAFNVFECVNNANLDLGVNYCSTIGKWQQLTARRERLLSMMKESHEYYLGDGVLESFYVIENGAVRSISRESVKSILQNSVGRRCFQLKRMAPLSIQEKSKNWISFEVLT